VYAPRGCAASGLRSGARFRARASGIAVLRLRGCDSTIVFSVLTALLVVGRRQAASAWVCQRG